MRELGFEGRGGGATRPREREFVRARVRVGEGERMGRDEVRPSGVDARDLDGDCWGCDNDL